ncbi:120.7 kDa protein in NOF-FB transposable element, partial [Camponotus floridanus]
LKRRVWTHIIAEKIYSKTDIPCAITFKCSRIYKRSSAHCYVHIKECCNECSAKIDDKLFSKPVADRDCIFDFLLTDLDTKIIHKRKRPLAGYLRQKVAAHLVDANKPASVWRAEQAKLLMKFGDKVPPNIPHEHVLRAKQQEVDKW